MDSAHSNTTGSKRPGYEINQIKKPETDLIPKDGLSFFKTLDKNTIIILVLLGMSLGTSFYLFKDLKKTKEQLSKLSNDALTDDMLEKIEENTQNIHTIDLKLDQLIKTMSQKTQVQQVQDQQIKQLMKLQTQKAQAQQAQAQASQAQQQVPQSQQAQQAQQVFMGGRIPTEEDDDDITIEDTHTIKI